MGNGHVWQGGGGGGWMRKGGMGKGTRDLGSQGGELKTEERQRFD